MHVRLSGPLLAALLAVSTGVRADGPPTESLASNALSTACSIDWISIDADLILDMSSNLAGGLKRKTGVLGNLDLVCGIDPEKAGGLENGHFSIRILGDFGAKPTEYVGDLQGTSNIEAADALKLYEAWYEHVFLQDAFSLRGGLYDYNSEFDVLEYASLFRNSSFGIGVEIAQVGPSIFPVTALAARGRAVFGNGAYFMAAAFDGVPGNPERPEETRVILKKDDGIFYAAECGIAHGNPAESDYFKLGAGGWYQTTAFTDYSGVDRQDNGGGYALAETTVLERLGLFLQLGYAMDDRNQIGTYAGTGLNWNGLFRETDELGFAVAHARNAGRYMDFNPPVDRTETALELTYLYPVSDHCTIQPDLQYVIHPSMDKTIDNAVVLSLRVTLAL